MKPIVTLAVLLSMLLAAMLSPIASTSAQSAVNDIAVVGDWDGDGIATPGVFRSGVWYLHNSNTPSTDYDVQQFAFGQAGDIPIVGDWDHDGKDTPGVVRVEGPVENRALVWYLRNSNDTRPASILYFGFGLPGDKPVVGDWNRDGFDTPGVVRQQGQALVWYLRNSNDTGPASIPYFGFGLLGDIPIVGDWNRDGRDTPGVVRNGMWLLRNSNDTGPGELIFAFDPMTALEQEVVRLVNMERAKVGCPALRPSHQLAVAADRHSTDMARNNFLDHRGSDGSDSWQRIRDTGYRFSTAAENIEGGAATAAEVVADWMNSPPHRASILNCYLADTGVGYAYNASSTYGHYWTQVFATR